MSWETPTYEEINMSAEIGSYDAGGGDWPPVPGDDHVER